ncbi:CRISPR-associated protein, Cmr5 family [Flexistipes sinusarabici DSM 4947]|uniref:CRISPR type III-B/RAMP module-associated protein Cmr5 n=1 Tax=Flexistipes sinusarabici (strain ATCC 49648 / DSM 4947 / MAS 10) TaxID=717231 RepID=F8E945_FLESM|nr:type III-B CRISPR module-associated protein Cmr5 [Flexistipes sinusarabici]AEI15247.1 CRISPR-associated protein, Cmr5 family [Flexistipes sinusarabici DSM 4947]
MRTLGQKRAEYALEKVLTISCDKKDFKSLSSGVPSMILQNGFGQTMAFLVAKGTDKDMKIKENDKHIVMFRIIKEWLIKELSTVGFNKNNNEKEFIKEISQLSQMDYLTAQKETLALLEWVKRYANAWFSGEESKNDTGS